MALKIVKQLGGGERQVFRQAQKSISNGATDVANGTPVKTEEISINIVINIKSTTGGIYVTPQIQICDVSTGITSKPSTTDATSPITNGASNHVESTVAAPTSAAALKAIGDADLAGLDMSRLKINDAPLNGHANSSTATSAPAPSATLARSTLSPKPVSEQRPAENGTSLAERILSDALIKSAIVDDSSKTNDPGKLAINRLKVGSSTVKASSSTATAKPGPSSNHNEPVLHNKSKLVSLEDCDITEIISKSVSSDNIVKEKLKAAESVQVPDESKRSDEPSPPELSAEPAKPPAAPRQELTLDDCRQIVKDKLREAASLPNDLVKLGEEITTMLGYVEDEAKGIFLVPGDSNLLSQVTEFISGKASLIDKSHKPKHLKENDPVLAMSAEDDAWYRAEVIEVVDKKKVKVRYVDYGNQEVLSRERIRRNNIPEMSFATIPKLAIRAVLAPDQAKDEKIRNKVFTSSGDMCIKFRILSYDPATSTFTLLFRP